MQVSNLHQIKNINRAYYKAKYGNKSYNNNNNDSQQSNYQQQGSYDSINTELFNQEFKNNDETQKLISLLKEINNRPYKQYNRIKGVYDMDHYRIYISTIQVDPFAPPSSVRVRVPQTLAQFPREYLTSKIRNVALCDYLTRHIHSVLGNNGSLYDEKANKHLTFHQVKGGEIGIDKPSQHVIQRTSVVADEKWIEARLTVNLPARGRTIKSDIAMQTLVENLPTVIGSTLYYRVLNHGDLRSHIESIEDQEFLRESLKKLGLIAFVRNGAILPRISGASDLPMCVSVELPNQGIIKGMGIPPGITMITGGGFHGKTTLLQALELGIYNHIPGDGREFVVIDKGSVKIRAENGRYVTNTDITPFFEGLPGDKINKCFSTDDASGSTSMAASIQEMLEVGATTILYDEDTCATNFLVKDKIMQELLSVSCNEPIIPLIDKIRQLYDELGVSTIIIIGNLASFLNVADLVIVMENYKARDVTAKAKSLATQNNSNSSASDNYGTVTDRIPKINDSMQSKTFRAKHQHLIEYYDTKPPTKLDLSNFEQLVERSQTNLIANELTYIQRQQYNKNEESFTINKWMDFFDNEHDYSLIGLGSNIINIDDRKLGFYSRARRFETTAALNRLRSAKMIQVESTTTHDKQGDLFKDSSSTDSLVNCVAQDLQMDKGIAAIFQKLYNGTDELKSQNKKVGQVAYLLRENRYIYYLITKMHTHEKPTKPDFEASLKELRNLCESQGVTGLSMPRIGTGLDQLSYDYVVETVKEIFKDSNIKITITLWSIID
ncbi:9324_t:CDS:10 [Entrophospora sp. SA101]|nr:9324_t:CDS:10 [Entrophospora sp. SA101]